VERRTICQKLEAAEKAIGELAELDAFALADPGSVMTLESLSARLDCVKTKVVGEFDAGGEWALEGAKTVVAWLDTRCHIPKAEARRQVRRAKALPHLPVAAEAFAAGEIGAPQFDALAGARTAVTEEALARDETMLVGFAKELKFAPFCTALALWAQRADPEGADEAEFERRQRRDVYLAETINGMFLGAMNLDAVSGSIVAAELRRREEQLFKEDWAEATERLGREPKLHELRRTSAQRRADAMVEMAKRSAAMPADARLPEAHVTFVVNYETIHGEICRIQGGPVVTPGTILEHLDGATFERIVFAPGQRAECSVKSRSFIGATRRAIEVRDQECTHEYCDLPAKKCEIDHIVPYTDGGETKQENGQVHCGFHNRLRNHGPPESGDHGPEPGG
jgi:Domain of unknown function (DUF222)